MEHIQSLTNVLEQKDKRIKELEAELKALKPRC